VKTRSYNRKVYEVFSAVLTAEDHPICNPVSSEISDLLLLVSYFTSQNRETKFDNYFFDVRCELKYFG